MFLKDQYVLSLRKDVPDFRGEVSRIVPIRLIVAAAEHEKGNARLFDERSLY